MVMLSTISPCVTSTMVIFPKDKTAGHWLPTMRILWISVSYYRCMHETRHTSEVIERYSLGVAKERGLNETVVHWEKKCKDSDLSVVGGCYSVRFEIGGSVPPVFILICDARIYIMRKALGGTTLKVRKSMLRGNPNFLHSDQNLQNHLLDVHNDVNNLLSTDTLHYCEHTCFPCQLNVTPRYRG